MNSRNDTQGMNLVMIGVREYGDLWMVWPWVCHVMGGDTHTTRSSPGVADHRSRLVSIGSTTNSPFDIGVSQKTIALPISA